MSEKEEVRDSKLVELVIKFIERAQASGIESARYDAKLVVDEFKRAGEKLIEVKKQNPLHKREVMRYQINLMFDPLAGDGIRVSYFSGNTKWIWQDIYISGDRRAWTD